MSLIATSSLGQHREFPLSPPLSVLPGDVLTTDGRTIYMIRGGVVVETRETSGIGTLFIPPPVTEAQTLSSVLFFKGNAVPGKIATITNIVQTPAGVLRFHFASGSQREFAPDEGQSGVDKALAETQYLDTEDQTAEDAAILSACRHSPDGTDLGSRIGSSVAIDFFANEPLVLSGISG